VRQVLGDPLLDRARGAMHTPESLAEERWRWRYRNHLIIVLWDGSDGQNQWCRGGAYRHSRELMRMLRQNLGSVRNGQRRPM